MRQDSAVSDFDRRMMTLALRVANRGLGQTAPNPSVGAVIADETTQTVIARGWTQPGGRPHAETEALRRAGEQAKGRTIYVTLEPCSHQGRTPPCADAIIQARLKRVVVAIPDPDPRVSGRGLDRLRAAGIEVTRSVLAKPAHNLTRGHIVRVTERRPFVQLKMALGADGMVAQGQNGQPIWVTGPLARRVGHMMRARADAILIGAGTLRDDDPVLDCRLPGLNRRSPWPFVVAGGQPLPPHAKLFTGDDNREPTVVVVSKNALATSQAALKGGTVETISVEHVDNRIWLPALAEQFVARGITRLLVEGGPAMWASMLEARMVDEIVQFRALGDDTLLQAAEKAADGVQELSPSQRFTPIAMRRLSDDAMIVFQPTGPRAELAAGTTPRSSDKT